MSDLPFLLLPLPFRCSSRVFENVRNGRRHTPVGRHLLMNLCRVVIADDHELLRDGVKNMLECGDFVVVGEAADGAQLLELLCHCERPDVAIVDLCMPRLGGRECAHTIKEKYPQMKVLIMSMHGEKEYVYDAVLAGADGYLFKDDMDRELLFAVETVHRGEFYLSPSLSKDIILNRLQERPSIKAGVQRGDL